MHICSCNISQLFLRDPRKGYKIELLLLHIANSFYCWPQNAFSRVRYALRDVKGRYI
jgi:hypothetical protein